MSYIYKLDTYREFLQDFSPQGFWAGKLERDQQYNYQVKDNTNDFNTDYSWESMKKYIGTMLGIVNGVLLVSCKHEGNVYFTCIIIEVVIFARG